MAQRKRNGNARALDTLRALSPFIQHGDYTIEPKKDFGNQPHWIDGFPVDSGYVVVKNHGNAMPGATWFQTVREAKMACDVLDRTGDTPEFWSEWKRIQETAQALARGQR